MLTSFKFSEEWKIRKFAIEDVKTYRQIIWGGGIDKEERRENNIKKRIIKGRASSPNIVRMIRYRRLRWARHVARTEEIKSAFKILTDKPTVKGPLGRPIR